MVIYRSREFIFQNRVGVVVLLICLVGATAVLISSGAWVEVPALGVLLTGMLVAFFFVPLTITVEDDNGEAAGGDAVINVNLAGVLRRTIVLADVKRVEHREYRPLREFGGWGWRQAWRRPAVAYTTRGASAVVLTLRSGAQVYLGVADEQALLDALKVRIYR